jgi:hypothetical protein
LANRLFMVWRLSAQSSHETLVRNIMVKSE